MKSYRAILCDFDGTLANSSYTFSQELRSLIKKLSEKGIIFSIATGRPYMSAVKDIIHELGILNCHIFHGGGMVLDSKTGKVLWEEPINQKDIDPLIKHLTGSKLFYVVETKDVIYMPEIVEIPSYTNGSVIKKINDTGSFREVMKIMIVAKVNNLTEEQAVKHKKELEDKFKDLSIMMFRNPSGKYGLDITSIKATKLTAVHEYSKLLNIPLEKIAGIGDGYNDYPLLSACGFKIAMENAPQVVKDIADVIVPTADNDGMIKALGLFL